MSRAEQIELARKELEEGIQLSKCQQCGCMRDALDELASLLPTVESDEARAFDQRVAAWSQRMRPIQFGCLGCAHCYAAVAQNALAVAFPRSSQISAPADFQVRADGWPSVAGEYFVLDRAGPVAVTTLGNVTLARELAFRKPQGLTIVGKTETENIGIDKLVKNMVSNSSLQYLIVAGDDPPGHFSGRTLLALAQNGVDATGRVIGSPGRRPILRNVSLDQVQTFRQQVQVIDLIGCEDPTEIAARVQTLLPRPSISRGALSSGEPPVMIASSSGPLVLDPAGYFVILPRVDKRVISVEHYLYDNTLLHVMEGKSAQALYKAILAQGWVTELTHAAYLGQELARAEFSLHHNAPYVQDGA